MIEVAHTHEPFAADAAIQPLAWLRGWVPLAVLPLAVLILAPRVLPPWAVMWLLAFVVYAACKWLTWRRTPAPAAPLWKHAGYLLAWPGLDAVAFLRGRTLDPNDKPTAREWLFATAKLAFGFVVLFGVVRWIPAEYPYLVGWGGMFGLVFVLHFGIFHVLSCGWRSIGVDASPLMNWPVLAESVSDYWGRRWNRAFRDLAHRFLFRPLTPSLGPRGAIVAGFLFSGIVHDVVISAPARGGYGGPSLFFLVQGLAMFAERTRVGRRFGIGRGWRGWLFTLLVVLLPAPLLFHWPFVVEIVVPFLRAIGAVT
jgi:hypothetical protein